MTGSTGLVCIVIIEWWWVLYPRSDIRWLFFHIYLLENYIDVWKETGVGAIYRKAWKVLSFKPWLKISFISCHTQRYMHLQQSTKISFQVVFSVRKCYFITPRSQNSKRQLLLLVAVAAAAAVAAVAAAVVAFDRNNPLTQFWHPGASSMKLFSS